MMAAAPRPQTIPAGEPDAVQRRHVVSALVVDRPGTLNRVAGLLRARSFNIESLTVGATDQPGRSRMTIALRGDEGHLRQVLAQLERLIEVLEVRDLHGVPHVELELAVVKLDPPVTAGAERQLRELVGASGGEMLEPAGDAWRARLTTSPQRIDSALDGLRGLGLRSWVRAGAVAITSESDSQTPDTENGASTE